MPSQNFSVLIHHMTVPWKPHQGGQGSEGGGASRREGGKERLVRHSHKDVTMHNEPISSPIFCPWEEVSGLGRAPGTVASSCPFEPSPQSLQSGVTQLPLYNKPLQKAIFFVECKPIAIANVYSSQDSNRKGPVPCDLICVLPTKY